MKNLPRIISGKIKEINYYSITLEKQGVFYYFAISGIMEGVSKISLKQRKINLYKNPLVNKEYALGKNLKIQKEIDFIRNQGILCKKQF
ncbi:MAG: hypothetical protein U9Q99_00530 [Nanoarchaeota archaeon]|nr:hypothetical protein [Nanoarchaeota archaeon]